MSRLVQRYWASLTDANLESLDGLIERGRRKDGPLWRRYLASLLDVELAGEPPAQMPRVEQNADEEDPPMSTTGFTFEPLVALEVPASAPRARRTMAGFALAAALATATAVGLPLYLSVNKQVASPVVIGTSPRQSPPPRAHRESGGFAWVTPTGWRRDVKTGEEVHYTSPDGRQELAAKASLESGDLVKTWTASEQNAHEGQNYRKIRLEEATFNGWPAVIWEYTFTLNDAPWHAVLLGFNANGKSYQINTWYQPDIETQALKVYGQVRDSFTVP
ncbi:hypothetical protein ACQEVG_37205 [Streptomyces sp. CA-135486]|uniref:hypothetical protein n=1 Tax=Streptomyces sp. CA-135486 TaxID=3240049 RepID=UPI003D8E3A22